MYLFHASAKRADRQVVNQENEKARVRTAYGTYQSKGVASVPQKLSHNQTFKDDRKPTVEPSVARAMTQGIDHSVRH
jgi:hypothetical protein